MVIRKRMTVSSDAVTIRMCRDGVDADPIDEQIGNSVDAG
jgi:hypothetical protein